MAITSITKPQELSPVYNDLFFIADSTNKNEAAFRYIAQVYINTVLTHAFNIAPMPTTLYGKLEASKLLASYLTYSHLFDTVAEHTPGSYKRIDVKWGEEYSTNVWDFEDYGYAGSVNWTNYANPAYNPSGQAKTMLYTSTADVPPFSAGDMIVVNQDSILRPELEGIQKVVDVEQVSVAPVEWMVVLDKPWIGSGVASPGSTDYADGQKSQTLNLLTQTTIVFNGAVPFADFRNWLWSDYKFNAPGDSKFLTSVPRNGYRVRPDSRIMLQMYQDEADFVVFESGGLPNGSYDVTGSESVEMIDASPVLLTELNDYTVHVQDASSDRISEQLSFVIDTTCTNYDDVEICFLDRMGSILPFQFRLKRTTTATISRKTYKHDITTDEMYEYSLVDAGQEDLEISEEVVYTLRTARLTSEESQYLKELISSPFTVVRFGAGSATALGESSSSEATGTSEYMRCHVLTNKLEIKDDYFDGARFEDIDIKLSNQDIVNW